VVLSFLALSLSLSLYFLGDGMDGGNIVVLVKAGWIDGWMGGWTKWMTVAAALFAFHGWHGMSSFRFHGGKHCLLEACMSGWNGCTGGNEESE
jgi:hypothetical protein